MNMISKNLSASECKENYHSVIYQKGKYRVIKSKDDNQWIFQVRRGETRPMARWRSVSYHIERKSLIRRGMGYFGSPTPIELLSLPEFYQGGLE